MRPIKYDAIQNDIRLMEMALYEVTKGQTQHADMNQVLSKVYEYKKLIKRGTYNIDQLEDKVFSRFGILNDYSKKDTMIYDATKPSELYGNSPFSSLFGELFRKSQGLAEQVKSDGIENPDTPDDPDNPEDLGDLGESAEDFYKDLRELDENFEKDQLDDDFPDKGDGLSDIDPDHSY
jgi:hypothetical protein